MYESLQKSGMWQGEIWNKRKNGEFYPEWLAITTIYDDEGQVSKRLAMFSDISSRKKSEERIHYQANYDALTDLPNRNLFQERLRQSINMAKRAEKRVAVIMLDIDNFKHVNDTLGHVLGDNLLCQVGERLTSLLRTSDTIARHGGDEFMIIINDVPHNADLEHKLDQILECLSLPYVLEGNTAYASASVGVTFYPDDGLTVDSLLQNADAAMFQAKKKGRNTYSFFTAEMNTQAQERHQMEVDLHRALDQHEFEMHYQPIVEPVTHKLVKAEALIRWNDPEKGLISPGKFIPVAEETGLIVPMGEWILRQSCKDCAQWYHETGREIGVSVNLSSQQFKRTDVYALVVEVLEETNLPAHMLSLEMTESILVDDDRDILTLLQKLRKLGVMLSIDDFGTGYSSLSYLKKFPITTLKIDRAFISDVLENEEDAALCMAILSMAQSLKLRVIAEGVELEGQVDFLRERKCHLIQGFFYSKPLRIADFRGYMDGDNDQKDQALSGV
jgi:diguanylate cyclase (GGDEF)-like protein